MNASQTPTYHLRRRLELGGIPGSSDGETILEAESVAARKNSGPVMQSIAPALSVVKAEQTSGLSRCQQAEFYVADGRGRIRRRN